MIVIIPPHSSKSDSTVGVVTPDISHTPASALLNVASGATKLAASAQVTSAISGTSITGSGAGTTSIVSDSTTAGLSQFPSGCTVQVSVIVPPQAVKLDSRVPGIVPLTSQGSVSPLLNVAFGTIKFAASSHVNGPVIVGTVITGSGAGATSMTTISSTELLSQPVGAVYVIVIVPPHSSKLLSTVGAIVPEISHAPDSSFVNDASGATKLAASLQPISPISGRSIVGNVAGSIVITSSKLTLLLSHPVGAIQVIVMVPPH